MIMALGEVFYYGIIFFTSIFVSRIFGLTAFGRYSLLFILASILVTIGNSGHTAILRKNLACIEPADYKKYIKNYFLLRCAIGLVLAFLGVLYLQLTQDNIAIMLVLFAPLFFSRFIDGLTEIPNSIFIIQGRLKPYFSGRLLYLLSSFSLMILGWFYGFSEVKFYWALVVPSIIMFFWSVYHCEYYSVKDFRVSKNIILNSFSESWPLLINAIIFSIYARYWLFYADSIFTKNSVASVSSAMTIVSAITLVPSAVATLLFPQMCRLAATEPASVLKQHVYKMTFILIALGIIAASVSYLLAPFLPLIFGSNFGIDAVISMKILSLSLIPTFAIPAVGYLTTVINQQKVGLLIGISLLLASLPIYYYSVKLEGLYGIVSAYTLLQVLMLTVNLAYFSWWVKNNEKI